MNDTAFRIYRLASQGFGCTQIIVKMALEEEEKENIDLIKAVNGLCGGIGYSKKTCGVITGCLCIFGLYAGKGDPVNPGKENFKDMIHEYMDWFKDEFGSGECADIIGSHDLNYVDGKISYPIKCGDILLKNYEKLQEILYKYEYDFGDRE